MEVTTPDLPPLEVEEWLSWLAVERGRAPGTLAAYRRDARRWWRWLAARDRALAEATEADVEAYVGDLRGGDLAPATVARAVVAVRSLHRFLADEGRAPADPGAGVASPRVPAGLPKALTEDEVGALLGAVVGDGPVARRDRALLEVLYGTGARISEAVGLRLADVDLESALLRLFGKGARERVVPVGRPAVAALVAWLGPGGRPALAPERWARRGDAEAVFLNRRGGRLTRQGAWLVVKRWGGEVGLDDRLTPHVLRHSCATHMLDHGADIRAVQELLGHASLGTTQVYTKVSTERLFAAYRAAHPRAGPSDRRPRSGAGAPPTVVGPRFLYSHGVPDQTTLSTLRGQLENERRRLANQIAGLQVGTADSLSYDENFADSGQVAAEQGENKALLNQLGEQLEEIDHALAKMDDGTYGRCEVCGEPIAEARLEAMPATRFCIRHA